MIEIYWPGTTGEWLAFGSAAVTVLFGLARLLAPRWTLGRMGLPSSRGAPGAASEVRGSMAGFPLGVGALCILFAQPFLYMALGVSWIATAAGRTASMALDGADTAGNRILAPIELALGALPLAYALGYLP